MPAQTEVNPQITDAVTQANLKVVAEAPAQAIATLYQTASQANGLLMANATSNQHNMNQLNPVVVAEAIKIIKGS
ncbi:RebB family R body protein [uncultured Roseibium sp.]|uniref:RebB family R body protein n=1 Tax=uncultured Roseibium sp. TaxID=1936171 RepID=UPI002609FCB2|nr:RebB family R body protein [uncultured Roseibium sp.]